MKLRNAVALALMAGLLGVSETACAVSRPIPSEQGTAAPATPPAILGYALLSPTMVDTLPQTPATPQRAAALRYGTRDLSRPSHAMARVHVEGTLPHQGIYDESLLAAGDWSSIRDLALAGRLSGDARYTEAAEPLMASWLAVYRICLNPIDETGMESLLIAYDLLPPPARARLHEDMGRLLEDMATRYLNDIEADHAQAYRGGSRINNWQSHRIKLATLAAFALNDRALIARARQAFINQLGDNIHRDGSTLDFEQRDALHYVVYDLEPLCMAALAAKAHGEDWYRLTGATGVGLRAALDWLRPYADGSQAHEEFVHSTVSFDAIRNNAGIKGFSGPFDPKVTANLYAYASHLDERYKSLAEKFSPPPWVMLVLP